MTGAVGGVREEFHKSAAFQDLDKKKKMPSKGEERVAGREDVKVCMYGGRGTAETTVGDGAICSFVGAIKGHPRSRIFATQPSGKGGPFLLRFTSLFIPPSSSPLHIYSRSPFPPASEAHLVIINAHEAELPPSPPSLSSIARRRRQQQRAENAFGMRKPAPPSLDPSLPSRHPRFLTTLHWKEGGREKGRRRPINQTEQSNTRISSPPLPYPLLAKGLLRNNNALPLFLSFECLCGLLPPLLPLDPTPSFSFSYHYYYKSGRLDTARREK